jgi:hypothetical protein
VPDDLLDKVHFNDNESAAKLAADLLRERPQVPPAVTQYLKTHYGVEEQLQAYAEAILETPKQPPIEYIFRPLTGASRCQLAPWCYEWGQANFYHDFHATHERLPALSQLLAERPDGFPLDAHRDGRDWLANGYIVTK